MAHESRERLRAQTIVNHILHLVRRSRTWQYLWHFAVVSNPTRDELGNTELDHQVTRLEHVVQLQLYLPVLTDMLHDVDVFRLNTLLADIAANFEAVLFENRAWVILLICRSKSVAAPQRVVGILHGFRVTSTRNVYIDPFADVDILASTSFEDSFYELNSDLVEVFKFPFLWSHFLFTQKCQYGTHHELTNNTVERVLANHARVHRIHSNGPCCANARFVS